MKGKFLCFVHIERSAGTTIHYLIRNSYPTYHVLYPWYYWSNEGGCYFTSKELRLFCFFFPTIKGIGGHTTRSFEGYEKVIKKPIFYFTFLREPISRYISHLNYQRQVMNIPWKIEDFINEPRFNNYQTVRIAGTEYIDKSKKALKEDFSFVGISESFDESLILLRWKLGEDKLCINYEKKNVSETLSDSYVFNKLSKKIQERIIANNQLDLELYQFALNEIYNQMKGHYEGNLTNDIEEFQKSNINYRFTQKGQFFTRVYRKMALPFIESQIHKMCHREKPSSNHKKKIIRT